MQLLRIYLRMFERQKVLSKIKLIQTIELSEPGYIYLENNILQYSPTSKAGLPYFKIQFATNKSFAYIATSEEGKTDDNTHTLWLNLSVRI